MVNLVMTVGVVLLAAVAIVLVRAAFIPNTFRVARATIIDATREKVFALINDMQSFNQWNPFAKMDSTLKIEYRGPASGPGAAYGWEGAGKAGKGSLEIAEASVPGSVTMKLDIVKPMEAHNKVVFALHSTGDATEVSWTMTGPYPYVNRLFGIFFNMDKIIGKEFESGLANLKRMAEL